MSRVPSGSSNRTKVERKTKPEYGIFGAPIRGKYHQPKAKKTKKNRMPAPTVNRFVK